MKTIKRDFPQDVIGIVHQTGQCLSRETGFQVLLHTRNGEETPCSAEVISKSGNEYADIGLEWNGKTLTGYDGVFDLPEQVAMMLLELGFTIDLGNDWQPD